jgi:hypothetical protein
MALLTGAELENVIQQLERRGVHCYHACQLKDFRTYLSIGGIPSRALMEASGLGFTPFQTDETDRRTGSWQKVFLNLSDFGLAFARLEWKRKETAPMPNTYGPILLVSRAAVLRQATDVAICLRSAGAKGFSRETESLSSASEVERIFKNEFTPDGGYANAYIKYSDELKQEFQDRIPANDPHWPKLNLELSCTTEPGFASFGQLDHIVVDEYQSNGLRLHGVVKRLASETIKRPLVWSRRYKDTSRVAILSDVWTAVEQGVCSLPAFAAMPGISEPSKEWAARLSAGKLGWQFERFATYLRNGTMPQLREAAT